ncbi:MAG TPA: hypothetical protein VGM06_11360 [Polyangiaceae bacterium]|jgi:hypothetical protein
MTVPRLAALPWTVAFAASVAACASILGIQDRTAIEEDGSVEAGGDAPAADAPVLDTSIEAAADARASDARIVDGGTDALLEAGAPADASGLDASIQDARTSDVLTSDAPSVDAPAPVEAGVVVDAASDAPVCADPCLLAQGLNHPFWMTSDANNVYWTEYGDTDGAGNGSVKSCPVAGCGPGGPVVLAIGLTNPRGIAVDAQNVYFATATYSALSGAIWKCAVGGCNGSPTQIAPAAIPWGVAVDGTSVYFADNDDNTVRKIDKGDGGQTLLYDAGTYDDAGDSIYLAEQCIVDGPYVYVTDYSEDFARIPIVAGGPITYLGSGFNDAVYGVPFGLTTNSANLYFGGNGVVFASAKANPGPTTTAATNIAAPRGLQYDPATGNVYWANGGSGTVNDGTVGMFSTDGGGQRVLQASLATPMSVAVGSQYVYWISYGPYDNTAMDYLPNTGALWRTTK